MENRRTNLKRILFTDETTVSSNPNGRRYLWLLEGDQNKVENMVPVDKFPKYAVMFWACVGYNYKSDLYVCPYRMNA